MTRVGRWISAGLQMCSDCFCPLTDKYSSSSSSSSVNKRQRLLQDFMSSIDQTGEFLSLVEEEEVDEVKQERLEVSRRREQKCARFSEGGQHRLGLWEKLEGIVLWSQK